MLKILYNYLVFAKAFDKADHSKFILKLRFCGTGYDIINLIADFLFNRFHWFYLLVYSN